ncbi:DNA-directed RNA polymerase subunit alpha [Desulfococcaceae bacterium HSG9]|nr:DNA-directed RNA polymerase subunit alpha [Desulfococcaceae bacterium HSG9]
MSANELMYMNWREMIRPEKVTAKSTPFYGKFVCEPLERGYGITIGNALRRILLSSLYGAAITSVRFDGIMHEFTAIKGVYEDISEIILNLKGVRFRLDDSETKLVYIDKIGEGEVTARDIMAGSGVCEVLNPNHHIATLNPDGQLKIEMTVNIGRGYNLSEDNKNETDPIGVIPVDSVFSPIKNVVYVVSNARVGQITDYDKLTIEIWTDCSVIPEDALAYAAKILKEQMNSFINFDEDLEPEPAPLTEEMEEPQFNENLYRSVEELELSVRSANCLKNANILRIYQLVSKTEAEMLKTKNFGRKSLNEIKEVLSEMDLSLGMKLEGFIAPEEETEEGELVVL